MVVVELTPLEKNTRYSCTMSCTGKLASDEGVFSTKFEESDGWEEEYSLKELKRGVWKIFGKI